MCVCVFVFVRQSEKERERERAKEKEKEKRNSGEDGRWRRGASLGFFPCHRKSVWPVTKCQPNEDGSGGRA